MTLALGILAALGTLGGLGGLAALVKVFLEQRKTKADAAAQITAAAAQYVEIVRDEMKHLRAKTEQQHAENGELRARLDRVESRLLSAQRSTRALSRWSKRAYEELVSLGSDIEAPPEVEHLGNEDE